MLAKSGDSEAQLQDIQSQLDEWNGSDHISSDVKDGLSEFFGAPPQSGDDKGGPRRLRILENAICDLENRLDDFEKDGKGLSGDALADIDRILEGCVTQQEFFDLRARVEGGFQCMVVHMESRRWMMEEAGIAGDKIVQQFTLNMDNRISELERRFHKHDAVVDKLCEKNHIKVKSVSVPAHCHKCGFPMLADAEFCRKCGAPKKARLVRVPKRALRAAQEHNFTVMKVAFDLWARGPNAECLKAFARELGEGSIDALLSPTSVIMAKADPAMIFNPRAGFLPKRRGNDTGEASPVREQDAQGKAADAEEAPPEEAAPTGSASCSTEGSPLGKAIFDMIDADNDGMITREELEMAYQQGLVKEGPAAAEPLSASASPSPSEKMTARHLMSIHGKDSPATLDAKSLPITMPEGGKDAPGDPRRHNGLNLGDAVRELTFTPAP
jgi:hypothetical protein